MKRIRETFLKTTLDGDVFYHDLKDIHVRDPNDIETVVTRQVFKCPVCGNPAEENRIRTSCPICNGPCCDFCHQELVKFQKLSYELEIKLIEERRRWLESNWLDKIPFVGWFRRMVSMNSLRRLEDMRKDL